MRLPGCTTNVSTYVEISITDARLIPSNHDGAGIVYALNALESVGVLSFGFIRVNSWSLALLIFGQRDGG